MKIPTSISGSPDRTNSAGQTSEVSSPELDHASKANGSTFTTVEEMKKAERQGEAFTLSDEQVVKAIERALKAMQGKSTSLEFSIHEETKLISVKVLNNESGEVIREIPPEKSLDFVAKLWEMAGIFVDKKA
ncbi:flagellar protein FlaG [Paenibacillus soyae]|uniref:Flagellar protein FlaG n=1 Tax=Paenibacillus soyae TaxID=2969249 RepID=A0A9X2MUG2_9BACL|nr:flagellar protein FlaG [Paenibacillus soyae]MCR2806730.1 flagellar protein FlaG [Paenibacillus soyae]